MKEDTENPGWFYFDLPALAEWISTHPGSAERARRIRQLAAEGKQAEVPGKFDF